MTARTGAAGVERDLVGWVGRNNHRTEARTAKLATGAGQSELCKLVVEIPGCFQYALSVPAIKSCIEDWNARV